LNDFFYGHASIYALTRESSRKSGKPTSPREKILVVSTQTQDKHARWADDGIKKSAALGALLKVF
jgi:hypothetical protein